MLRPPVRLFGLLVLVTFLLVAYMSGLTFSPTFQQDTNPVFLSPRPILQQNAGRRSLKTGFAEADHTEFFTETAESTSTSTATMKAAVKMNPTQKPKRPAYRQPISKQHLGSNVEIMKETKRSKLKQLASNMKKPVGAAKPMPRSLFNFSDLRAGRNSVAVQYGLNKTLLALNNEFSPFKFKPQKFLQGLNIPFIKEKANPIKIVGNLPVGTRITTDKARHVLIATTWRSGSTFLGDLMNHYPGSFYYFEPLHYYAQATNLSSLQPRTQFLKSLFQCNFSTENLGYLHHAAKSSNRFLFKNHNSRLWRVCSNLLPKETMCFLPDYLNAVCPVHPIRLVKTVRLRVAETEKLLQDPEMNLKVIVLVRDPRGTYASRHVGQVATWCKAAQCADPSTGCSNLLDDYEDACELEKRFPGRLLLVRYEDLSLNTEETVRDMLAFLDLPWTSQMTEYINTHTNKEQKNKVRNKKTKKMEVKPNPYSTTRNSTETAFKWRQSLAWNNISTVQETCRAPMARLGYVVLEGPEETQSDQLPIQFSPAQIWPFHAWS